MRINTDTKGREQIIRRLMEETGENTKVGALFVAAEHYLNDKRNKEKVADELAPEHVEALSTTWLPMDRPETKVGREEAGE